MTRKWNLMKAACLIAAIFVGTDPLAALAQSQFPSHRITIVVPLPPGGFADTLPRLVAEKLSQRWGQPVLIVNKPGAALNIGAEMVARAAADGYTLLATPAGPLATNRFVFKTLPFDPDAFVPVTVLARGPFILVARPGLQVSSLTELIAYAKANPGKVTYASSGSGSPPQLTMALLAQQAGIRLLHVPFKGLAPALNAVMAGQVDLMFHDFPSTMPQIKAGTVRALGVGSEKRLSELPQVPAIAELLPGFSSGFWYAVVAPPGTPPAIVAKLSAAMAEAVRSPDIVAKLDKFAIAPGGDTPAATAAFLKKEIEHWHAAVVAAGIKAVGN
jgi:tripartite-type tricarboxylate transporter receptor subunit TctC